MISKERVNELVGGVLEAREKQKDIKAYITGAKEEIGQFMSENNLTEIELSNGSIKISDSSREAIDKEKVESEVSKVNSKQIDHIDMSTLYKVIDIHSISIKAKKEEN